MTFGWCIGPPNSHPEHDTCPHQIETAERVLVCGCPCHREGM